MYTFAKLLQPADSEVTFFSLQIKLPPAPACLTSQMYKTLGNSIVLWLPCRLIRYRPHYLDYQGRNFVIRHKHSIWWYFALKIVISKK